MNDIFLIGTSLSLRFLNRKNITFENSTNALRNHGLMIGYVVAKNSLQSFVKKLV